MCMHYISSRKDDLLKDWTLFRQPTEHTKSSAIISIFPTALEMASNKDFPGPAYCHEKKFFDWILGYFKENYNQIWITETWPSIVQPLQLLLLHICNNLVKQKHRKTTTNSHKEYILWYSHLKEQPKSQQIL